MKDFKNLGVAEMIVDSIKTHLTPKKEEAGEEVKKGVDLLSIAKNLSKRHQEKSKKSI